MSIEAMKLALEVIQDYIDEYGPHEKDSGAAYTLMKLDQAIEQANVATNDTSEKRVDETQEKRHEPVAMVMPVATVISETGDESVTMSWWHEPALPVGTQLYTTSPQRQPEQEPVAWTVAGQVSDWSKDFSAYKTQHYVRPVYTPPPQRQWVGLTNNDWNSTPYDTEFRAGAEWAEAKLKEKNT